MLSENDIMKLEGAYIKTEKIREYVKIIASLLDEVRLNVAIMQKLNELIRSNCNTNIDKVSDEENKLRNRIKALKEKIERIQSLISSERRPEELTHFYTYESIDRSSDSSYTIRKADTGFYDALVLEQTNPIRYDDFFNNNIKDELKTNYNYDDNFFNMILNFEASLSVDEHFGKLVKKLFLDIRNELNTIHSELNTIHNEINTIYNELNIIRNQICSCLGG